MLTERLEQDHRQQVQSCPSPRRQIEGRGQLADPVAGLAGDLLADGLNDLPLTGNDFQRLGNGLKQRDDWRSQLSGACLQCAAIENRIRRFVMKLFEVE